MKLLHAHSFEGSIHATLIPDGSCTEYMKRIQRVLNAVCEIRNVRVSVGFYPDGILMLGVAHILNFRNFQIPIRCKKCPNEFQGCYIYPV